VVKHENHTPTGSFKARGGLVYVDSLRRGGSLPKGLVTATRGNHGQSVALAAARLGLPAVIVVPGHDGWVVGDEAAVFVQYDCGPETVERLGLPASHGHDA